MLGLGLECTRVVLSPDSGSASHKVAVSCLEQGSKRLVVEEAAERVSQANGVRAALPS
jgi:capsular polysaccharide biosynthesis protein